MPISRLCLRGWGRAASVGGQLPLPCCGGLAGVLDDLPRAGGPGFGHPHDDGAVPAPGRAIPASRARR
eukprot:8396033-Pyramimonas_sp.AAC.1